MIYHSNSSAYNDSYIKTTVEARKTVVAPAALEVRLITIDELKNNLGYELDTETSGELYIPSGITSSWIYGNHYWYSIL